MVASLFVLEHWVALSVIPKLGGRIIARLMVHFDTPDALFSASVDDLRAVQGVGPKLAAAIQAIDLDRTRADIAAWQTDGIAVLHRDAAGYPAALRDLDGAPPVLFQCGTQTPADARAVAIVGTRRPRPESRRVAHQIATALAEQGWTVISGLAAGIDTAAHTGAVDAGGRTLAVLGCGVHVVYPPENASLAARICANGALLSETHPDASPQTPTLVARNRLISGLSRAVVVVETGVQGGSMHTVRFARAQGIPLCVVAHSAGGNRQLGAEGAYELPGDAMAGAHLMRWLEKC
ncbi:MAG: DNA-protecting protein DprA [Anaerolineae bacterium]|nr:DNA-protecting protein DprA [Anaerolineae bacterium]